MTLFAGIDSVAKGFIIRVAIVQCLWQAGVRRDCMLGEGEGLELIAVFVTFMVSLGIMVVLGKWWEA